MLKFLSSCSCLKEQVLKAGIDHLIILEIELIDGLVSSQRLKTVDVKSLTELLTLKPWNQVYDDKDKQSVKIQESDGTKTFLIPITGDMEMWKSCMVKHI